MMFLVIVFVLGVGLIVGSFLNAVIYRLEVGDSVVKGRSYCPHCKHTLVWYDLVPLVSFAILQGKCRYCSERISIQYPLVEMGTAVLFLSIFNFQFLILNEFSNFLILQTLYLFTIAALLVVLFVYDLKHYILPDKIVFPAMGIVAGYRFFEFLHVSNWNIIGNWQSAVENHIIFTNPLAAGILACAFFLAIFLLTRGRAMGFGDVKLAFFMGLFLGWPNIAVALFSAFMIGGVVGIILIFLKKKKMKSEVPFGPFLIGGTFIALYWGELIADWYWNLVY